MVQRCCLRHSLRSSSCGAGGPMHLQPSLHVCAAVPLLRCLISAVSACCTLLCSLNRYHYAGIGCCVLGIALVGTSSMLSGECAGRMNVCACLQICAPGPTSAAGNSVHMCTMHAQCMTKQAIWMHGSTACMQPNVQARAAPAILSARKPCFWAWA